MALHGATKKLNSSHGSGGVPVNKIETGFYGYSGSTIEKGSEFIGSS